MPEHTDNGLILLLLKYITTRFGSRQLEITNAQLRDCDNDFTIEVEQTLESVIIRIKERPTHESKIS